jgi:uncharacterized damage-inducible protein DinB
MASALHDLLRHNLWATLRLMDTCTTLDDALLDATVPGTYGSIRATLYHVVLNQERYLDLLHGAAPAQLPSAESALPSLGEIRRRLQHSGDQLIEAIDRGLGEQVLRGDWHGQPFEMAAVVPLIAAINHATEHRAQIAVILSHNGIEPPTLDAWTFWQEGLVTSG